MEIGIDIETRSGESLKFGVYKYVESPEFEILLFAYSINGAEPLVIDLTREEMPEDILSAIKNPEWLKTAHNAQFERVCINKYFGLNIGPEQWHCTMILAASLALPLKLEEVSKVLHTTQKDNKGRSLIRYFCVKTKKDIFRNPHDKKNLPKWEAFKQYNLQDVRTEQEIRARLKDFLPYNTFERNLYLLDQKINDCGVKIDYQFIKNAILIYKKYSGELLQQAKELTGLSNPNSVAQLKKWILQECGLVVASLNKEITIVTDNEKVLALLELRKELSKASIKKYTSMFHAASASDNRVRGLFQMYGANRTGRWAGRIVQPQNFPKNPSNPDAVLLMAFERELIKKEDYDFLKAFSGDISQALSMLLRTAFIPEKNNLLLATDFSAIEARVLSWLANEKWKLEVFRTHGKIYEATASQMFGVPIEQITKGSSYRQKGKIAELALGYQGSVDALLKAGAGRMGMNIKECEEIVMRWRAANPNIMRFWYAVECVVKQVLTSGINRKLGALRFEKRKNTLLIWLPSGRPLMYLEAKVTDDYKIVYKGPHQTKKLWMQIDTYGGKLVENIVQAIARDLLAEALVRIDKAGYTIVMHVHDEIISEVSRETCDIDLQVIDNIMCKPVKWAEGLPLKGDSYLCEYYKKED